MTDNLKRRIFEHYNKRSPYTKKFSEIKLVYNEECDSRASAVKRELQIKGWSVAKKNALINGNKELLVKLSKSTKAFEATGGIK